MIQRSLSLDNERSTDCTELLLGMHKHIGSWWEDIQNCVGKVPDKRVIRINDAH